jgi:hypothetical protein
MDQFCLAKNKDERRYKGIKGGNIYGSEITLWANDKLFRKQKGSLKSIACCSK